MKHTIYGMAAAMAVVLAASGARAGETQVPFQGDDNIQSVAIAQFPTGLYKPSNHYVATFNIPVSDPTTNLYNLWDDPTGDALSIPVGIDKAISIYLLAAAYAPPFDSVIATVTAVGNRGAVYSKDLVAGVDIRDFCQGGWDNQINHTTTIDAYKIEQVQGGCGTGNVTTGSVNNYRIDEIKITLPAAFNTQRLTNITITPSGFGQPIIAGITVLHH